MESAAKERNPGNGDLTEIWKPIRGYEGSYEVSNLGRVRSLDRRIQLAYRSGKIFTRSCSSFVLKPRRKFNGYYAVNLYKNRQRVQYLVHRLVAEAFLPRTAEQNVVNHLDYQRFNNRADNLEWTTPHLNNLHSSENMCVNHQGPISASGNRYIYKHNGAWQLYIQRKYYRHCRSYPTLEAAIQAKEAYFNAQQSKLD